MSNKGKFDNPVTSIVPALNKKREEEGPKRFNFEVVVEAKTEKGGQQVVTYTREAEDAFSAIADSSQAWRPSYALPNEGTELRDPAEVVSIVVSARRASVHKTNPIKGTKDE